MTDRKRTLKISWFIWNGGKGEKKHMKYRMF